MGDLTGMTREQLLVELDVSIAELVAATEALAKPGDKR